MIFSGLIIWNCVCCQLLNEYRQNEFFVILFFFSTKSLSRQNVNIYNNNNASNMCYNARASRKI